MIVNICAGRQFNLIIWKILVVPSVFLGLFGFMLDIEIKTLFVAQ